MSPQLEALLPADKSWFIRIAFLCFIHKKPIPVAPEDANDDIKSLLEALKPENWAQKKIFIGDGATAYRFLQFYVWKFGKMKEFIKGPILAPRPICNDPSIVQLPQKKLLKVDNTSQWASACALCGNPHRVPNPPFKLAVSYEALDAFETGNPAAIRPDATILRQAEAFLEVCDTGNTSWKPSHSEDFCFANAFALMSARTGAERWPSLAGHESNRPKEMLDQMESLVFRNRITSKDHRVIQAVAMFAESKGITYKVSHPLAVAKSWPRFWDFLKLARTPKTPL